MPRPRKTTPETDDTTPVFTDAEALALQAIIDRREARRAADAHADIFAALGAVQNECNALRRAKARADEELAETRAELAAARREVDRLVRAASPHVPDGPVEPDRVVCTRCHAVLAIVGRDTVPEACHACGLKVAP